MRVGSLLAEVLHTQACKWLFLALLPWVPAPLSEALQFCAGAPQIEKAGGYSSADGKCISGLDVPIENYDQRTQICYGSLAEVRERTRAAA